MAGRQAIESTANNSNNMPITSYDLFYVLYSVYVCVCVCLFVCLPVCVCAATISTSLLYIRWLARLQSP